MNKFGKPLSYTYSLVEDFVSAGTYLIGIGNSTTPWVVEGSPPEVDLSLGDQPEVALFVPAIDVSPVINFPIISEDTIEVMGKYFIPVGKTLSEIAIAGATSALIKAKLTHSQISTAVSYRSLGVHDRVELTQLGQDLVDEGKGVPPSEVLSSRLVFIANLKPISIQSNVIEFINVIIPI